MKIEIQTLLNSKQALESINRLPFKALHSYKIKKAISVVNECVQPFREMITQKQKELGDKPSTETIEAFEKELNEAAAEEIEIEIQKIKLSWFAKSNGPINEFTEWHNVEPGHFQLLEWLIEDDVK